jgi:aspartate/methionine/tyrosine aminotransferase
MYHLICTAENHHSDGLKTSKRLTLDSMSEKLKKMEYAVRGKVVIAADRINLELKESSEKKYPFDHIVFTNIGNPHSVGQVPLTWPRQVMALVELPKHIGVDHPDVHSMFSEDVIQRAREIHEALDNYGLGAYTHSQGPLFFRREIAEFIEKRDGLDKGSVDPNCIFMTNGASSAINMILTALIADSTW